MLAETRVKLATGFVPFFGLEIQGLYNNIFSIFQGLYTPQNQRIISFSQQQQYQDFFSSSTTSTILSSTTLLPLCHKISMKKFCVTQIVTAHLVTLALSRLIAMSWKGFGGLNSTDMLKHLSLRVNFAKRQKPVVNFMVKWDTIVVQSST